MKLPAIPLCLVLALPLAAAAQTSLSFNTAKPVAGKIDPSGMSPPQYPREELIAGRGGKVDVSVSLDAGGKVIDVTVATSSGNPALDAAGIEAAKKSAYLPGKDEKGVAVPSKLNVEYEFTPDPVPAPAKP